MLPDSGFDLLWQTWGVVGEQSDATEQIRLVKRAFDDVVRPTFLASVGRETPSQA